MRTDWPWLAAILALSLAPRLYTLAHTTTASRDCVNFIQMAVNLDDPPAGQTWLDVLRRAEHPPAYPAALLGTAYLAHGTAALGPDDWIRVGQLVSVAAGCWLVLPVYILGRQAFDRRAGIAAAAFAVTLPTLAEVAADALSDALFLAAATTALALAQHGLATGRRAWWAAAGAVVGLAYLVRPEGLLCGASASVMLAFGAVKDRAGGRAAVVSLAALAAGFLAVGGPYVAVIGKLTNKPSGGRLLGTPQAALGPPLAAWAPPADSPRPLTGAKLAVSEPFRAANYGVAVLGLVGAIALRKNRPAALLLVHAALGLLLLGYLGSTLGYVSRRHALTVAMIACVFAAGLLVRLAGRAGRHGLCLLIAAVLTLVAAGYPFGFKKLHANRAGHQAAGLWAAGNVPPEASFQDPFTWTEFYAGRSMRDFPNQRAELKASSVVYAVVEPRNPNPDSKLPLLEYAKFLASRGALVFHWPPDAEPDKADVAIYRVDQAKPEGER